MTVASAMVVLWFAAGVLRSLYGHSDVNELDGQIWLAVQVIFGFLFGGVSQSQQVDSDSYWT